MGAQTSHSLELAREFLASQGASLPLAQQLFAAGLGLSTSPALRHALSDSSADTKSTAALANAAFAGLTSEAKKLIAQLVELRWSSALDLQAALEELAIRSCATGAGESTDLVGELLGVSDIVHAHPELELGLGSKRASASARANLIGSVIAGKVSAETQAIVRHLVSDPRGRRIGAMLHFAAETVAHQHGKGLAIVSVAQPLTSGQHDTIQTMLSARYGRPHYLAQDIDDSVVGGARIRVGDNVIDGSIATRLSDLRNTLAG
ncbi:MAG: F0F1 ATP synthase subunit delta [Microbacteriaceae bacterium]|jgi:F-type H+-transporting ATPase subunit delta|nr:F0F1 ATP synthase subunit delta [Pontimonas sp.]MBT5248260.1 F0F1 ATP synthase subunit delta [Microbacteriaceae bacterium]MBT5730026.1 F0F1 ATP synthase subunit delta [Microbacteriaceae bacterium]MBT7803516.1 F0F1 ATP synthase subunit delta [Microbacteriaceae bacterium]MDA9114574.1 F0F1 ATP synthase subunit delta [Pontimonas sp.]